MIDEMKIVDVDAMTEISNTLLNLANQVDQTPSYLSEVVTNLGYTANYSNTQYQFNSLSDQAVIIAQKIRELMEWLGTTTEDVVRIDQANADENYEAMNEDGGDGGTAGSGGSSGGSSGGGSGGGSGTGTGASDLSKMDGESLGRIGEEQSLYGAPQDGGTEPSAPTEPKKPEEKEQPTEPEKPEEKEQPTEPNPPTEPSEEGGGGGGGSKPGEEPTAPTEPSAPTEPNSPSGSESGGGMGLGGAAGLKSALSDALDTAEKKNLEDEAKKAGAGKIADATSISPTKSSKGATKGINPWALAGFGLAAGSIALGTGLLVKYNSYYTFGPEDWAILNTAIQNTILNDFKAAGFTKEEVETFVNSTFKVKATDFDRHIKNVKKANELDTNLELELNDLYGFSCYDSDGKLVKYALFIMMIIDGKNATDEFNLYNILNASLDDADMDLVYSGIDLYEYIEDEYTVETTEEITEPQTEPSTTDYFS